MKALTICQPYAHLICLPDDHPQAKRVENRKWYPNQFRGTLLIHAGQSKQWLNGENYGIPLGDMTFGAIIGVANLVEFIFKAPNEPFNEPALQRYPWLETHQHAEGPWCWILSDCRRFEKPIRYRGFQGLFDVPDFLVASQLKGVSA